MQGLPCRFSSRVKAVFGGPMIFGNMLYNPPNQFEGMAKWL